MKLVVVGATGFVATEVIRQALHLPQITSVLALARRSVAAPAKLKAGGDASKLTCVIIEDLGSYPQDVMQALRDVDACIWTPSIGPLVAQNHSIEEVKRVNNDYPLLGLKTIHSLRSSGNPRPLRFVFMSGYTAIRSASPAFEPDVTLPFMDQWRQLRGHAETLLSSYAASTNGGVEVCSARPGIVTENGELRIAVTSELEDFVRKTPKVDVEIVAAALLEGVVNGFADDPLLHEKIVEVGEEVLSRTGKH